MSADILADLDAERLASGEPAGRGGVVREYAADGSECRIVFSRLSLEDADDVIREEMALARDGGYTLEWKLYGHDVPSGLDERLLAAGFEADDTEQVLVLPVNEATLETFKAPGYDVRRIHDEAGLADYAEIAREIGRKNPEEEKKQLAAVLLEAPDSMSVHIAYVEGEPVACGRIYFKEGSGYAELAGGRTKTTHRKRGLFTAVVGARLTEAHERGRALVFTDALPTSEPILRKRGFRVVTSTQPFVYEPAS
ncbi:GNAT family N-acetyltransferase [Streptomyces sp. NPDC005181]|uniref:GNAT family N-acetyltransferase n=1 Tax=Streptomyces sp. NPDC005181 TaxID=3156869 RepID=UPI0033B1A761